MTRLQTATTAAHLRDGPPQSPAAGTGDDERSQVPADSDPRPGEGSGRGRRRPVKAAQSAAGAIPVGRRRSRQRSRQRSASHGRDGRLSRSRSPAPPEQQQPDRQVPPPAASRWGRVTDGWRDPERGEGRAPLTQPRRGPPLLLESLQVRLALEADGRRLLRFFHFEYASIGPHRPQLTSTFQLTSVIHHLLIFPREGLLDEGALR